MKHLQLGNAIVGAAEPPTKLAVDILHHHHIRIETDTDAASQVARLLLSSLSEASDAVKGLSKSQVVENLVAPLRSPLEFDEAFEKLRTECWYLHGKENDAWYFSKNENLKKKIEKYAATAAQPKIDAEIPSFCLLRVPGKQDMRRLGSCSGAA